MAALTSSAVAPLRVRSASAPTGRKVRARHASLWERAVCFTYSGADARCSARRRLRSPEGCVDPRSAAQGGRVCAPGARRHSSCWLSPSRPWRTAAACRPVRGPLRPLSSD